MDSYQFTKKGSEKEKNKGSTKQPKLNMKALISPQLSIMTLNVNRFNTLMKRPSVAKWIKKQDSTIRCLQETHFIVKETYKLKVER